MNHFARQTIAKKQVKFWKIFLMIIITVTLMDYSLKISEGLGPVVSSVIALAVVGFGTYFCVRLIYNNLAEYNYRLIENKIILERHIGRANYSLLTIPVPNVISIDEYTSLEGGKAIPNRRIFTNNRDRSQWFRIQYSEDGQDMSAIFEPDDTFLESINANLEL